MSRNSKRQHETIAADVVAYVDAFEPDFESKCQNCGQSPTVLGVRHGKVIYASQMCGACTWGEAACIDPANW